ncbi:hypothetical protein Tco_0558415 [Tanacetum coccineum]
MNSNNFVNESDDDVDITLLIHAYQSQQLLQQKEAKSSLTRIPIYRECDIVEARLLADYFGDNPKYPEYHFRRQYRINRKLFLEIVEDISTYTSDPLPEIIT